MNDIKLLRNNVLVKQEIEADETEGGIIISVGTKTVSNIGNIVAVSESVSSEEVVKVGDNVIFEQYSGSNFEFNDEKCLLMTYDNILAIIDN